MKTINNRDYRVTDSELIGFAGQLCYSVPKDLPYLQEYGITEADILAIEAVKNQMIELQNDSDNKTLIILLAEDKNKMSESIIKVIKQMALRVELQWGKESSQYKQLGNMNVSRMSQIELNNSAKIVHTMMTEYLPSLAATGLTQAMLDGLAALIEQYEANISERLKIENNRINMTEKRKTIGNKLYAMVKRVCITAQIAVPNKAEFYLLPTPRKKKKKESDTDEEKGEMKEGKF